MVAEAERALADISRVRDGVGRVIFGQEAWWSGRWWRCWAAATPCSSACPASPRRKLVETLGAVLGLDAAASSSRPT